MWVCHRKGEAIVRRRPSAQQLIEFCSCCRSAATLRWLTAPECSGRSSLSCSSLTNSALLCHARGGKARKKGSRLSAPLPNVESEGTNMSAKGYPLMLKGNSATKPEYNVRIISLDDFFSYHKRGSVSKSSSSWEIKPTLCWPVILSRPQKPTLHVQEWGILPQWPWLLNAKMPVQLSSKDQVNMALAAVNGPSVSK